MFGGLIAKSYKNITSLVVFSRLCGICTDRVNLPKYEGVTQDIKKAALSQISALKWRVGVIQGQSFYAHWKADKLLHVAEL